MSHHRATGQMPRGVSHSWWLTRLGIMSHWVAPRTSSGSQDTERRKPHC